MSLLLMLFYLCCLIILWLILSYFINGLKHTDIPIVSYQITGNKNGKPLVFIHGWPDLCSVWNKQIEYFKDEYLCINIELPNFDINKCNNNNPWGYDIPNLVKGIANQIQYILLTKVNHKYKDIILIIHDWGSPIGQALMIEYPNIVSHTVIIDIGDSLPKGIKPIIFMLIYQMINIYCFLLPSFIGSKIFRKFIYRINDKFLAMPTVELEKKENKILLHPKMNYLYFYLYKMLLTNLFCCRKQIQLPIPNIPTFFCCGKWKIGPWHTKKWKEILMERKDCKYVMYSNSKHWVMHDECDTFNKDVKDWLNQLKIQ